MLNAIIQFALRQRGFVLAAAVALLVIGGMTIQQLPIDVLPDLTRPRVTIVTECRGMAPEEVERLVTIPIEIAVNGTPGQVAVRSQSDIGLSVIYVEFDWGSDVYQCRQIVSERLDIARQNLPADFQPRLAPLSSLLGQIMLVGLWTELPADDPNATTPMELRTMADWVIRPRLQNVRGVSEVIVMGGEKKQYHVLIDIHELHRFDVTLQDVESALRQSNYNVNGGFVERNSKEFLVRGVGRMRDADQLKSIVVGRDEDRAVLLENVASIEPVGQPKRGDAAINGFPAVVLTIQKQPATDTRVLSDSIRTAIGELRGAMPEGVRLEVTYQQSDFIDASIGNVVDALRDGTVLVIIVLILFLLNVRTTVITLVTIPVSIVITALVFRYFELSINVMTLGGIAVALGELVDDAIVDVENIYRRLRQNAASDSPQPVLKVIYLASVEVRNSIIFSTVLVILAFAPVFALGGITGRLFVPLGIAYIVSILASTAVSLTLTPVLSWLLLSNTGKGRDSSVQRSDTFLVHGIKSFVTPLIRLSMTRFGFSALFLSSLVAVVLSCLFVVKMGKEFLPTFDEGATQLNLYAEPGTSLSTSSEISKLAAMKLSELVKEDANEADNSAAEDNGSGPDRFIQFFTAKTGRAENDEHIMGVNTTEYTITPIKDSEIGREESLKRIAEVATDIPGVQNETEQPIAHLISHMLSGVTAQIAVKLYGDDLDTLVRKGNEMRDAIATIPGLKPPFVEQQQVVPQLQVIPDYAQLAAYKLNAQDVLRVVETAMQGRVVSTMVEQERSFDVVMRFSDEHREDVTELKRLAIDLPSGGSVPLSTLATVRYGTGRNTIQRDDARRRIVVRVNTDGRDLESAVAAIRDVIDQQIELPQGYHVHLSGLFEAQQAATRRILILSAVSVLAILFVLYSVYQSFSIALQIVYSLPLAFAGGVFALWLTDQSLTVSAMVGFISLGGIAARNGLLLVSNYLHETDDDGTITQKSILAGSLERLTPVLMTTLTTAIGLLPLIWSSHLPGRELLYPVATVLVGGLFTSTLCEFLIRPGMFYYFGPAVIKDNATEDIFV
ncbi:efflux RND transporter permease subunit [Mariniblastus sp.]|nr:efflux RND transporter permease subunit [Mariniblastus sp.]